MAVQTHTHDISVKNKKIGKENITKRVMLFAISKNIVNIENNIRANKETEIR